MHTEESILELELEGLSADELKTALSSAKEYHSRYYNYEQSVKRILNSIYGAFGNQWFEFFNLNIAESITLQGQDAILYAEEKLNDYFFKFWHKDTKLHEAMGITNIESACEKPVVIYIDTDSCYVAFEEAYDKCDYDGPIKDFIIDIYKKRLSAYLKKCFDMYAESFGTEDNFLFFELESIADSAIWLAKKKYIQDITWVDPDIHYESLSKVKTKGFDTIQASTPSFARKKMNEVLKLIFSKNDITISEIARKLKEIKDEFKLAPIEDISFNYRLNNYSKYIIDDQKSFEYKKGVSRIVRGAGHHNFLLNNSDYKGKYQLLNSGERVKVYYCTTVQEKDCEIFSFSSGEHPYEIAPSVDYDTQFEKCILDPINRVLKVIGLKELDTDLVFPTSFNF